MAASKNELYDIIISQNKEIAALKKEFNRVSASQKENEALLFEECYDSIELEEEIAALKNELANKNELIVELTTMIWNLTDGKK